MTQVIFDNAGGVTLMCDCYAHYYDNPTQAAEDVAQLVLGAHPTDWEGNEPEARVEPTDEQIRNGGYRVLYDLDDLDTLRECDWGNVQEFIEALAL